MVYCDATKFECAGESWQVMIKHNKMMERKRLTSEHFGLSTLIAQFIGMSAIKTQYQRVGISTATSL